MFEQIKPNTPQEEHQLQAANLSLEGKFKEAITQMLLSLGLKEDSTPEWVSPPVVFLHGVEKQKEGIGNIFLSSRLEGVKYGEIAAAILAGHYEFATYLMAAEERAALPQEELPEDLEEMMVYLETHPQTQLPANDSYTPSWLK